MQFWISAMGFKTWKIFSGSKYPSRRSNDDFANEKRTFMIFAIYAQGLPFVVCIITAIVDACREGRKDEMGLKAAPHFPNMGVLRCFVGEQEDDKTNYFASPKFLYHDMFMVFIHMINLYFYGCICVFLCKGWENQASIRRLKGFEIFFINYEVLVQVFQGR